MKYVSSEYEREEFVEDLKAQNPLLRETIKDDNDMIVRKIVKVRNNQAYVHIFMETSAGVRRCLVDRMGYAYIGYQRVGVENSDQLTICYHCLRPGHSMKTCRSLNEPAKCSHCGGDHKFNDCDKKTDKPVCGNCRRGGIRSKRLINCEHSAMDKKNCGFYNRMIKISRDRTEY
jgi:hypothetical protein